MATCCVLQKIWAPKRWGRESGAVVNGFNLLANRCATFDLCFAQIVSGLQVQPELRGRLKANRQPQGHIGTDTTALQLAGRACMPIHIPYPLHLCPRLLIRAG